MKRVVYGLFASLSLLCLAVDAAWAESGLPSNRLSPSNLQRLSRDLTPSSAQDFFKTGQTDLENEIRLLIRPRSALHENLLIIRESRTAQPTERLEQPAASPHNERLRGE